MAVVECLSSNFFTFLHVLLYVPLCVPQGSQGQVLVNILLHISEDHVTVPEQGAHAGHSHDQRHYHFYGTDGSDRHINATAFLEKLHALPGRINSNDDADGQLQPTQVIQSGPLNIFMKSVAAGEYCR